MLHPNQDIYSQRWLDIVFERRNKQYGAYLLRLEAAKYVNIALFVDVLLLATTP